MTFNSLIRFPFLKNKGLHKVPYYPRDDFKTNWEAFKKRRREVKKKREKRKKREIGKKAEKRGYGGQKKVK